MNEFIVSTKGSLWECSCPECQNRGERQGSRKGSRKGRTVTYADHTYDVSDIDRYIAEGNIEKGDQNVMQHKVVTYLMNEKGYKEMDAALAYDAWARVENLVYGIPDYEYTKHINKYRKIVGLPPLEDSHKGSRKGSRKGYASVDGKSPMEYLKMLYDLQGFPSQRDVISQGSEDAAEEYLRNNASFYGLGYEEYLRTIAEEY